MKQSIVVKMIKLGKNFIEFDIIGPDASICNAIRRVSIADIPTMAIETIYMINNTSVIPDEVLCHRLGLVPIYADPRKFDFLPQYVEGQTPEITDQNTLVFLVNEKCKSSTLKNSSQNTSIYSNCIKWSPQGSQSEIFGNDSIRVKQDDILLVKLRPGQQLEMEIHCSKGVGRDHAKFSPVSKSSYRLLPKIEIKTPIKGEEAVKFAGLFSPGVINIVENEGVKSICIGDLRNDSVSRECLRHSEFSEKVSLSRVSDHFIFQIETVGYFGPVDVVKESINAIINKCQILKSSLSVL